MQPTPMQITVALIPLLLAIGLFVLAALWLRRTTRLSEMAHRERMAMIDRGLAPPPEPSVPASVFGPEEPKGHDSRHAREARSPHARFRTLGVQLIGLGFALMLIIGVTGGAPGAGIGTGGAVAVLGVALVVNAYLSRRDPSPAQPQLPKTSDEDLSEVR